MKNRIFTLSVALFLLVCASAWATDWDFSDRDLDGSYDAASAVNIALSDAGIDVNGEGASADGSLLTISDAGTYVLTGALSNGRILVAAGEDDKVQLVLAGADIYCETYAALYIQEADKVFVTLADGTQNRLGCGPEFVLENEDDSVDAAVFSRADLTFNGSGALTIEGNFNHGVVSKDDLVITGGDYTVTAIGHGLNGKDCVKIAGGSFSITAGSDGIQSDNDEDETLGFISITGGSFSITAGNDAIQAETQLVIEGGDFTIVSGGGSTGTVAQSGNWGNRGGWNASADTAAVQDAPSTKGLKAGTLLHVSGGTFFIDALDDTLHANGDITIDGGSFDLSTDDDGVHADGTFTLNGGSIDIARSYEGLEGADIIINGGTVNLIASDDGINSAGGSDSTEDARDAFRMREETGCNITINGGSITIDASGDGIDANGSIYINGGEIYVNGPVSGADGALDYAEECVATGGALIAVGSSQMAQGFSQNSTQCAILVTVTGGEAGRLLELMDAQGNVLASFTPSKSYSSVAITAPGMTLGETHRLLIGGEEAASIDMDSMVYSQGGGFGGRDNMMNGGGFDRRGDARQPGANDTESAPVPPEREGDAPNADAPSAPSEADSPANAEK